MTDKSFSPLTRSMTFVDQSYRPSPNDSSVFSPRPLRRSQTFVGQDQEGSRDFYNRSRSNSSITNVDSVKFRRHFVDDDSEIKAIPLINQNGITLVDTTTSVKASLDVTDQKEAVIVVDTFSSGALLANILFKLGYKVICILSGDLKDLLSMIPEGLDVQFAATLVYKENIESLLEEIDALNTPIAAVFAGAETGVELADLLSETLRLRTNGTAFSEARRNKFAMGEAVRNAGNLFTN